MADATTASAEADSLSNRNIGVMNPVNTTTTRANVTRQIPSETNNKNNKNNKNNNETDKVSINVVDGVNQVDDEKKDKTNMVDIVDSEDVQLWNKEDYNTFKYLIKQSQRMTKSNESIRIENKVNNFTYLLDLTIKSKRENEIFLNNNNNESQDSLTVTTSKTT